MEKIFITTLAAPVIFDDLASTATVAAHTKRFELSAYDTVNNILDAESFTTAVANRTIIATDELGIPVNTATTLNIVGNIDCSGNPNYPAATKGESYRVSVAGKIGGGSGTTVQINDVATCLESTIAGTEAAVGSKWVIGQGNLIQATETVSGIAELATDAECLTGTNDTNIVTPLKMATYVPLAPAVVAKARKFVKVTIGFPGDTGKDFTWTSAGNATEQNLDLGALIPAKASDVDIVIVCDQAINTGAIDLAAGSASSGEQYIASANCDATTDILGIATGAKPIALPLLTAGNVWIQGTKTGNWSGMTAGRHSVYISYNDNAALD